VLLAKEEMVLQGVIDRLIETGIGCREEMNVRKKTKLMRISRKPSRVEIMIDKKQLQNMQCFSSLGNIYT
jgi:hypothetical protein